MPISAGIINTLCLNEDSKSEEFQMVSTVEVQYPFITRVFVTDNISTPSLSIGNTTLT